MTDDQAVTGPDFGEGIPGTDVREGQLLEGQVAGEPVLLTRHRGVLCAVGSRCTHYGGPLVDGLVVDGTIRCPWHHAAFDLRTGGVVHPPALDPVSCWRVEERDGRIRVIGRLEPEEASTRMAAGPTSVIVIGGGAAGLYAAETLRREGYGGPVTVLEAGPHPPCDRPNLSKDYLAGSAPEEWLQLRPPEYYGERDIALRLDARAVAIDVSSRSVRLADGAALPFGALLIATGAEPVRLDRAAVTGRMHYLRTIDDSRALIAAAENARHAIVLGAGFIGLEVAAALRARGLAVTVVAPDKQPLGRVLGPELGAFVQELHEEQGVTFRLGRTAASVEPDRVRLDDGAEISGDLVVAGLGVRPRSELAEQAGIATDRGIVVNEYLETSAPGIFAAGDVARWPDHRSGARIRVEHWVVAERQGQAAARNILAGENGRRVPLDIAPFFWSRHYDVTINYTGHAPGWDELVIDGDIRARDCSVTYKAGGRTLAVATIGRDRDALRAEAEMESSRAAAG